MKVLNTYIVTCKSTGYPGDYTTVLYECIDAWYILSRSAFGPGTVFCGLNSLMKIREEEALEMVEDSKINKPH